MQIFEDINNLQKLLKTLQNKGQTIGFVPTMGALHEGHLSLIEQSTQENDYTVVSIYVNPTQFNNASDLENYPRTLEEDAEKLETVGCDFLFFPNNKTMYPQKTSLFFDFGDLERRMEGAFREGHFNGVALVVSKLFNIVKPNRAYFGQKDWQQYLIIKALKENLFFDLEVIACPIKREVGGLAMSSRNMRLNVAQRKESVALYQALNLAKKMLQEEKASIKRTQVAVNKFLEKFTLVQLEYFEVVNSQNLKPIENIDKSQEVALCMAAYLGEVRLIDNIIFQL